MNVHYFIPLFLVLTRFALIGQIFIAPISPSAVSLQITPGPSLSPFPIRAAFYYPWFPESWSQSGIYPFTKYYPLHGYYSSDDPKIIANQIAAMQYGKIQVGIASWWGQGHFTDMRIPLLLKTAEGTKFQWSLYLESEGYDNPSILSIRSDLKYIHDHYAGSPDLSAD